MFSARVTEHGRGMWLHHGCRCEVCHSELLEYAKLVRAVQAARQRREIRTHVPVANARRHVARLRAAGWTVQAIADAAGVSFSSIDRIANRARSIEVATARAVLAVS